MWWLSNDSENKRKAIKTEQGKTVRPRSTGCGYKETKTGSQGQRETKADRPASWRRETQTCPERGRDPQKAREGMCFNDMFVTAEST